MQTECSVAFIPDNLSVHVPVGTPLLRAATLAGLELTSACGGKGTCGRCVLRIVKGTADPGDEASLPAKYRGDGYVLACKARVQGDITVEVPGDSRLIEHQVLVDSSLLAEELVGLGDAYPFAPICRSVDLSLDEPTLVANASDLTRLQAELRRRAGLEDLRTNLAALRQLGGTLRACGWKVSAHVAEHHPGQAELIAVSPGHGERKYGLAVDIGTTTVVVDLVDLATGLTVDKRGTYNKQARYGDDVIARIIHAAEDATGLKDLTEAARETINELIDRLLGKHGLRQDDLLAATCAGNTTMTHLFLGVDPRHIRVEPYIPTATCFPVVRAGELGLRLHPGAPVVPLPAVASYVGGDVVAGVLATGLARSDSLLLFIDIGTNGEIVLGNKEFMVACSCSAGPCFEGGGISNGMRAMKGAIQRLHIDPATYAVEYDTIAGARPIGLCGSGLVDALAELRRAGIIDRAGKFVGERKSPSLRRTDEDWEFVVAPGSATECGRDLCITESDVKNLIRAKAAVYAGISTLLRMVGMDLEAVERIYIAGGFGSYLNVKDAVGIGLLPDVDPARYRFIGNSSVKGAKLCLLSKEAKAEAEEIARRMTYLELSLGNTFMDEFVQALFLPHTNLKLFPSAAVQEAIQ
ncbi:MAG: ASKHA domain-containing protein [Bacillota bacterium]